MPPRLGCRKSRRGCVRCKTRKVKCDECRPVCGWCQSHGLDCEYPSQPTTSNTPTALLSPVSLPSVENVSHETSDPQQSLPSRELPQRQLLDLALLHYYVTTVAPTFPYVDPRQGLDIFADAVPQLAIRCSCLLHAMHAYALLHFHVHASRGDLPSRQVRFFREMGVCIRPTDEGDVVHSHTPSADVTDAFELHQKYLNHALMEQRTTISNIDRSNADAVCLASLFIGMIALVHTAEEISTNNQASYTIPLRWFYLIRSFTTCLNVSRSFLEADSATMKMIDAYPNRPNEELLFAQTTRFKHLLDWQPYPQPEEMDGATFDAYHTVFLCIESIYNYIIDDGPSEALGRRILACPNLVSDLFMVFLEEKRPRALVMLAHLLAMSKTLDRVWWIFRGVADIHVKGLLTMIPAEWQWGMSWPLQTLSQGLS